MSALRRTIGAAVALAVLLALVLAAYGVARGRPQDLPWTPLDLGDPVGAFTGRKLAALTGDFGRCRQLLDLAGVRYATHAQPGTDACGYTDGIAFERGGARRIALAPGGLRTACPVAAALAMWEWNVLQPAAQRHFGSRVARIDHMGSYSCRRLYGRDEGAWSEHATADAIDIAGFRLADGTAISVLGDWDADDAKAAFLREVRDGACGVYATVLSPEYNAAHRDHLHLDQAERGQMGGRVCR